MTEVRRNPVALTGAACMAFVLGASIGVVVLIISTSGSTAEAQTQQTGGSSGGHQAGGKTNTPNIDNYPAGGHHFGWTETGHLINQTCTTNSQTIADNYQ